MGLFEALGAGSTRDSLWGRKGRSLCQTAFCYCYNKHPRQSIYKEERFILENGLRGSGPRSGELFALRPLAGTPLAMAGSVWQSQLQLMAKEEREEEEGAGVPHIPSKPRPQ
jgi:hypothetical protein